MVVGAVRETVNDQLLRLSYKDPKNIKKFLRSWGGLESLSLKGDTVATCILCDLKTVTGIDIERWEKVEKLLRKHDLLGWNWYKDDSWLEDLEKALSSSYPKELEFTLDALKREVNRLEKLKEECNAND